MRKVVTLAQNHVFYLAFLHIVAAVVVGVNVGIKLTQLPPNKISSDLHTVTKKYKLIVIQI